MSSRALRLVALACCWPALAACHRSSTDVQQTASSAAPTGAPPPAPVDHLAPGELVEGGQQAFGIPLPRDLRIDESFAQVVYASGRVPVHALVQYFRPRLQDGGLREGTSSASFEHVKLRGKPGLELAIHITTIPGATRVEIRDTTPPPAPSLPDETSRWKQVGLTPDGRLADPTHLD